MKDKSIIPPRKRAEEGRPLSTYVNEGVRAEVEHIAHASGVSISHAVRMLVLAGLKYYAEKGD